MVGCQDRTSNSTSSGQRGPCQKVHPTKPTTTTTATTITTMTSPGPVPIGHSIVIPIKVVETEPGQTANPIAITLQVVHAGPVSIGQSNHNTTTVTTITTMTLPSQVVETTNNYYGPVPNGQPNREPIPSGRNRTRFKRSIQS